MEATLTIVSKIAVDKGMFKLGTRKLLRRGKLAIYANGWTRLYNGPRPYNSM